MTSKPQTIGYKISFTLTDYEKLRESYPNYRYNYGSFREFVAAIMADVKTQMPAQWVKGVKVKVTKLKKEPQ